MKPFLNVEDLQPNVYDSARVVLLSVPFEGTVSYGAGTAHGPAAILEASSQVELYDDELDCEPYKIGIYTAPPIAVKPTAKETVDEIYQQVQIMLKDNKTVIMLGGEHSITSGAVKAHKEKFPNLSVLHIDAHADLRDQYEGDAHSHASAMRRVLEHCPIVQVGIRSMSQEEADFLKTNPQTKIFSAKHISESADWIERVIASLSDDVYISFDLDGLDPSIMPATGTPEPGGLGWHETLKLLKKVAEQKNIVGADIVELAPQHGLAHPDFTAARLVYKLIGYTFFAKP